MIQYITGNILESPAQALVNTVNTVGVMGKGIALQFKKAFPNNYRAYEIAAKQSLIVTGRMFVTTDFNMTSGEKIIINFPTKKDWRKPSEYTFIEEGLIDLVNVIREKQIISIAIPPLGSGNGGLEWERVKKIIEQKMSALSTIVYVYEPTAQIKEHLKNERIKLTEARALLLYVLYDLVREGEFVSEFSSEKVCYFLQRFGARPYFKLEFEPRFYGPYSGKVRYILNALNGSYIMGYSDMSKKPFDPLTIVSDGYETVIKFVENDPTLVGIARKTISFLRGFYSDFGLELLSSIDFITSKYGESDSIEVTKRLAEWSDRKHTMFSNPKYIDLSMHHLKHTAFA